MIYLLSFATPITCDDRRSYIVISDILIGLWHITVPNGFVNSFKHLIKVEMIFLGDIRQGVKSLRRTTHTHQFHIHEHLQKLGVTIQKFFDGDIGRYIWIHNYFPFRCRSLAWNRFSR